MSYAAIASLTVLALGLVLWTTLRIYYRQQELDYLKSNVQTLSPYVSLLIDPGLSNDILQSQLETLSFLSQTRLRVLGPAEEVLGDSGDPLEVRRRASVSLVLQAGGLSQTFSRSTGDGGETRESTTVISSGGSEGDGGEAEVVRVAERVSITGASPDKIDRLLSEDLAGEGGGNPQLGFGLVPEAPLGTHRSGRMLRRPVYGHLGELVGYVEVSEGPAIGREVMNTVAWGWAVSGGVAVTLAAAAGWVASRRITKPLRALTQVTTQMAGGDLFARADVARGDELGQLATSFNEMAQRVEDTVLTLRRFVGDAAHGLNTPLTALRTNLELMEMGTDADRRVLIGRAEVELDRLEALCQGLLDLSRVEAAGREDEDHLVDLGGLVREAGELYASRVEQAGLSWSADLPEEAIFVRGSEGQLRQALLNLLDNAIKFTPDGGEVSVALRSEGDHVTLSVEDTGIGVAVDDVPRLFDRFHRGQNAADYPGSGLGLTIVRAIVERHRGRVAVEARGRGTALSMSLPRLEEA